VRWILSVEESFQLCTKAEAAFVSAGRLLEYSCRGVQSAAEAAKYDGIRQCTVQCYDAQSPVPGGDGATIGWFS
jgi:hypothetical protein